MAIADTSDTRLAFIPEVTWGTTPATPAFQKVRYTGEKPQLADYSFPRVAE